MPTYEYECTKCGHTFEAFQSITEKALSRCPKCGSRVKRLIGGGLGVIFKGSGFYTTDYKKSSALTGNGRSSSAGKESEGKEKEKQNSKESSTEKTAAS
jgi:putative FmdB family regulatory protein